VLAADRARESCGEPSARASCLRQAFQHEIREEEKSERGPCEMIARLSLRIELVDR
jgi:hypothetical protein